MKLIIWREKHCLSYLKSQESIIFVVIIEFFFTILPVYRAHTYERKVFSFVTVHKITIENSAASHKPELR